MNVSFYSGTNYNSYCFQESANVSNQTGLDGNCGLNYSGNYNFWDESSIGYISINYTKLA
jgi:hypothetical protein